jgi:predicted DsbA family dithiol-disulfide isomerase
MKILMVTDVVSPFCWMAPKQIDAAIARFPGIDFELELWPFQVTPGLPQDYRFEQYQQEHMTVTFGNMQQVKFMLGQVEQMGKAAGCDFNLDKVTIWPNSKKAHGLWMMHPDSKQRWELHKLICQAHFSEGKNLNDLSVLAELGAEFGLKKEDVCNKLSDDHYIEEVLNTVDQARQQGVSSVPFIVVNDKFSIAGAKHADDIAKVIQRAIGE